MRTRRVVRQPCGRERHEDKKDRRRRRRAKNNAVPVAGMAHNDREAPAALLALVVAQTGAVVDVEDGARAGDGSRHRCQEGIRECRSRRLLSSTANPTISAMSASLAGRRLHHGVDN